MIPNLFFCWSTLLVIKELWTWTEKSFIKAFGHKNLITLLPGLFLSYTWRNNTHIYDYLLLTACETFARYVILFNLHNSVREIFLQRRKWWIRRAATCLKSYQWTEHIIRFPRKEISLWVITQRALQCSSLNI